MTDQELMLRNGLATPHGEAAQRIVLELERIDVSGLNIERTGVSHKSASALSGDIFRIEPLPEKEACFVLPAADGWFLHWMLHETRIHLAGDFFPSAEEALQEFKLIWDLFNRVSLH